MSRIASTSTNADRLTGLPNTYRLPASPPTANGLPSMSTARVARPSLRCSRTYRATQVSHQFRSYYLRTASPSLRPPYDTSLEDRASSTRRGILPAAQWRNRHSGTWSLDTYLSTSGLVAPKQASTWTASAASHVTWEDLYPLPFSPYQRPPAARPGHQCMYKTAGQISLSDPPRRTRPPRPPSRKPPKDLDPQVLTITHGGSSWR
jgi:hypothetical protein